jgi:2-keto-4-pentenoate hydratase/2-oxohepta-3-ene-1,7-dioic acid hydratase in catechol pathway
MHIELKDLKPTKIVCVGRNYSEHVAELGNPLPKKPLIFLKAPSALIFNEDPIVLPACSNQVEHEAELAIVISQKCKNLTENQDPLSIIAGFTCLNDVTARDIQREEVQFTRAKSFDTFCPIGPELVNNVDPSNLEITCRVNGVIRQKGNTTQMIFSIPYLIRYISQQMTLLPGDIISTGTPAGVSQLKAGDVCEVEIEGIGILRNPIINGN